MPDTIPTSAGVGDRVTVVEGDIPDLQFADGSLQIALAEAVTMFGDRAMTLPAAWGSWPESPAGLRAFGRWRA